MLNAEGQWSEALASNNIRAIIRWLERFTAEGDADVEEILPTFSCWVQRTSEFAKKELLTLCFSRCQGLWMFLDRSSFTRVHMLLQRLRNLLTLAQWARRQFCSAHLWHGVGVPCIICRDTCGSSDVRRGCWNREHRALKQHIWLGRLVQWWGITGLLPKLPDAQEVKRIAQMWKEMDHSHRKACLETPGWEEGEMGRCSSLIQGMVTQLDREHGCIWASEDCTDQCYPPPNLQALLKLVLVPRIDNMSVQAILMYFILDVANFLQCKDDLLRSFCHAFTIPSSFSQQIRAFWMFDHRHIKASMELLLSPRATVPWVSWQHRCIIHCLLTRKQPQVALRYLQWARPAIETVEDAKLYADVLLQSSCVSYSWALLKRDHTAMIKKETPPCPLSAKLYQAQKVRPVSSEDLIKLVRKAVMEVRKPDPKTSEVAWPEHAKSKSSSGEMFLSTQALCRLKPSPSPMDMEEETEQPAHTDDPEEEQPVIHNQQQLETQEHISSSEDLSSSSASSFTSASSLLRGHHYEYERTLTMQRISSLITDGENHSSEEEKEDSRTSSSTDALPGCPERMETPDGVTDLISLSGLDKASLVELMFSAEGGQGVLLREGIFSIDGPSTDENLLLDTSFSNEDSQSVPDFLSRDNEKTTCCEGESEDIVHDAPHVTPLWGSSVFLNQEDPSGCTPSQVFSFSEAAPPDCFLEKKLPQAQKACAHHQQEEPLGCFSQDLSCSTPETTLDLLTDLHQSFALEELAHSGSPGMVEQDSPPVSPVCSSIFSTKTSCNIKTTSAPSDTDTERPPTFRSKTDEPCVPSTSAWPGLCKVGSWWQQGTETAAEPGAASMSDKRPSLASQPYTYSLAHFMDFTAKQRGDNTNGKQAEEEEPAGWSSLRKASQGAIRSGRTRSRTGKRMKRT